MRFGLPPLYGAKSTRFSIISVVSFSHVHAISSKFQCNSADLPSGRWVTTLPSHYPGYQRKLSTWPLISNDSCVLYESWRWCWIPLHWLSLGFRIIRKCRSFITSNYRIQQICFIFSALQVSKHNPLWRSFVHLTAISEPFLHKLFPYSIIPLELVKHFPCPNRLPQLLLEQPTFGLSGSHLALFHVVIGNSCASTAWAIISFQDFSAFRKSFVQFRHACTRHAIVNVNLSQ